MLRPFFSYYGSKWRLAPKYPSPRWDTVIEPFAGSAGYSLRYPDKRVILIERDPQIAAIWRWLIAASPDDVLSLPRLKRGESLLDYEMPQEARWLMGLWIGQASGIPRRTVTPFGVTHQYYRERVAGQLQHIRHWKVIEGSYQQAPDIPATWFIDPPYQVAGRHQYRFNCKTIDYDGLAVWCKSRSGQVIACENVGAAWLPFQEMTEHRGFTDHGKMHHSKEAVWLG